MINRAYVVAGLLAILLMVAILACSQSNDTTEVASAVPPGSGLPVDLWDGWETVANGLVQIHYPAEHPLTEDMVPLVADYSRIIKRTCDLLDTEVPTDSLHIMYYTGMGQGREMTGREYPFAVADTIHFWLPSFLGTTLMQYLIPKWQPDEPRFQFFKHGVIAAFDYSGQNYHESVMRIRRDDKYTPLAVAVLDSTVDSNIERMLSAEAGSFVEFVLRNGGAFALNEMYSSRTSFDSTVATLFGISVDSIETLWLDYAALNTPPDTTDTE